jgi:hypothetical protein
MFRRILLLGDGGSIFLRNFGILLHHYTELKTQKTTTLILIVFKTSDLACFLTGEIQVKLSLLLTKHHAKKTCWAVEVYLHAFLTS